MFPIAWAIIDKENTGNLRLFLAWLAQELESGDGSTLAIISDMQKVWPNFCCSNLGLSSYMILASRFMEFIYHFQNHLHNSVIWDSCF